MMDKLSLKQFIYRREAINLYREFLKTLRGVENKDTRRETRQWIREEFDKHNGTFNEQITRMELTRGNTALRELKVSINLLK